MENDNVAPGYHVWGVDNSAYGPIELPTLVNWIKEDRVIAETWIFLERDGWHQACALPELKMFFKSRRDGASARVEMTPPGPGMKPGTLRRIKSLVEMTDDQLGALLKFVEIVQVRPFTHLVHKGDPPDAMYGVLEGELRSCIIVDGKECPLATLTPGSIFGEISFFDQGPHAADVLTNMESTLVKISNTAFAQLSKDTPDAALALLSGLVKAIAGRVRTLTRRYEDSVHIVQRAEAISAAA